jgi:type VI secretion system protein ImpE
MNAKDLYTTGQLAEAVAAAAAAVKAHPADAPARMFFCELLCFAGDFERADKQLDAIGHQDPGTALTVTTLRQVLRAEVARQQCFNEGRVPEFLGPPSARLQMHLDALVRIRTNCPGEAAHLLQQAEQERPALRVVANGKAVDDFRDLDDLTASFFEVLTTTGKYYWVPMEQVDLVEFEPPRRPADLLWRPAHFIVRGGPDGRVFLPALYPGSHAEAGDGLRLGRLTEWHGGEGTPVRGAGLRTFLLGDEDLDILQLKELKFTEADA